MPDQQKKEKTSQYKGVYWNRKSRKWRAQLRLKGEITKSGGYFNDELDAGKRVNQLCEEMKIPLQNPAISDIPNQQYRKKEKISKYKGVYWHKSHKKWYVRVFLKGQKLKYGGSFKNELDAAKKVNQLCEDFGISQHNPDISTIPNVQVKKKFITIQRSHL